METWKMIEPNIGDHIRVKCNQIYHHGIYIGNNEVIAFGHPYNLLENHDQIEVVKTTIEEFLQGGFLEVRIYQKKELKEKRKPEEIVAVAKSKLGEKGYNILHNNCEHFANFCVFGKKISIQTELVHQQVQAMLNKNK